VTLECTGPDGQDLDIGQAAAFDSCCDVTVTNDVPDLFNLGETIVTWTATDCNGNSNSATQKAIVQDTVAPQITLSLNPDVLWPPNHKMVEITPLIETSDLCCDTNITVELVEIRMNESEIESTFDPIYDIDPDSGYLGNDIQIIDGRILLRAERAGKSEGRTYTITYNATDCAGNISTVTGTVTVPHDMK
jgi:hypothetical protein